MDGLETGIVVTVVVAVLLFVVVLLFFLYAAERPERCEGRATNR